jgi:N-acetylneuraminate synthase
MDANPVFIAEASSNHGRDLDRARAFVDAAADAGCDAVKFQLFKIDRMFAPEILRQSPKHRARAEWELPLSHLRPLAEHCSARRIQFSCTPFYLEAVAELEPFVDFYKVASYELLVTDLLAACARTGKPVVLSTGMATMEEIAKAAATLTEAGAADVTLLHCVSAYPTPANEANLSAIRQIREATGLKTGWSDHTRRPAVIERAVHHWNAAAVEFHLDLDGNGAEYAAGHCWLPEEIAPVIARIREAGIADGSGFKGPQPSELSDREWRADPADGMRPLRHVRRAYRGEAA